MQTSSHAQTRSYPGGFMVLHGNRLEDLRTLLIQFLQAQPLPALQAETILVQSNGMKHWLELALADDTALGICAATRMELPSTFLWQVYRQVLGARSVPAHMPFDKDRLLWRLMRLLPQQVARQPVYAPLLRYLGDGSDSRRLYQLAQQIADVFDAYQSYRADWLDDWAQGGDLLRGPAGQPHPLPPEHAWQAQLWRDLREDVGPAWAGASRASVHARFMATLRQQIQAWQAGGPRPAGLPPRIVVFGISSLPMQTVEALALMGQAALVLLLVQNPCQYFWGDIVEGSAVLRRQRQQRQQPKPTESGSGHPLLASWGKQGRDYLHLLDGFDQVEAYRGRINRVDVFVDPVTQQEPPGQLAQLQSAILNLEALPETPLALALDDASITLHSAHSAQREVEILHDTLLAWFDGDASLQPRDIMVMVPDMERFAPHIHAVFGRFGRGQSRHIPYSVADTHARRSPLAQAVEQLLRLPQARLSLVDWLGLFEVEPLRNRFALETADVAQLWDWLNRAGVRWGLDATHRRAWGIGDVVADADQNTWAFGLRRLLLGYAVGAGQAWAGTLPQAAIGSLDARLVSQLLAWVDAISLTLAELQVERTPTQWCDWLALLLQRFFAAGDEAQERQLQRLQDPLEHWQQACQDAGLDGPIALDVVREHWLSLLAEPGLQQHFFGGGVQFATLMPMRSIPFAAICLLGMNDGEYPRQRATRDFDLMSQSWRPGDRSRREDDRYLFLEALLSARQRLYISWQGHRASDNSEQPPSVLVAQLIDHLHAGWSPARAVRHWPLQPYAPAYFLKDSPLQTYDADWARLLCDPAAPAEGTPLAALAATQPVALSVEDLRLLLRQPAELFFRSRLQVRFDALQPAQSELEPFCLQGLERYQLSQDLLRSSDPAAALDTLRLSGRLPMAGFGMRAQEQLARELELLLQRRQPWQDRYPHTSPTVPVMLEVDGMPVSGHLAGLWSAPAAGHAAPGQAPLLQCAQRLGAVLQGKAGQQVPRGHIVTGLWANHVLACASGMTLHSVLLGLDGEVVLAPLPVARARDILQSLVQVYRQAWQRPLPIACETGWAFLQARGRQPAEQGADDAAEPAKDPHELAQDVFEGSSQQAGERARSPYLVRAFASYQDLEEELPHWAQALYGALAAHAVVHAAEAGGHAADPAPAGEAA